MRCQSKADEEGEESKPNRYCKAVVLSVVCVALGGFRPNGRCGLDAALGRFVERHVDGNQSMP